MTPLVIPKYEARCERCGHHAGVHTTSKCANLYRTLGGEAEAICDCAGWKRDMTWPPPVVVGAVK